MTVSPTACHAVHHDPNLTDLRQTVAKFQSQTVTLQHTEELAYKRARSTHATHAHVHHSTRAHAKKPNTHTTCTHSDVPRFIWPTTTPPAPAFARSTPRVAAALSPYCMCAKMLASRLTGPAVTPAVWGGLVSGSEMAIKKQPTQVDAT